MQHPGGARILRWSRRWRLWARLSVGAVIIGVLVWRLGARAFLDPLQRIDVSSLTIAVGLAVLTTVCCAWRWRLVSRGLGDELPLREAVGAYYRSQFLNTVLPGGVLGDVDRGVSRGRDVGSVGHGLRAVGWERSAGQVIQIALTMIVLLMMPSPVRSSMPIVTGLVVTGVVCAVLVARSVRLGGHSRPVRIARVMATDLRKGLLARHAWPGVVIASALVVAGHTATFLVAARTAGSTASLVQLLPLALLVLLATGLPTSIAGWGPREGMAAWVFAVAGLGAAEGIAVTVVYGVMALVATLPGAALLLAATLRPGGRTRRTTPQPTTSQAPPEKGMSESSTS